MRLARFVIQLGLAVAVVLVLADGVSAQTASQQPQQQAQAQGGQPQKPAVTFQGDAGLMLVYVKADKTADFEDMIAKLKDGAAKSELPDLKDFKQQAAGWTVYKATTGPMPQGSVLYVMYATPVVKNVEYWFLSLLYKVYPAEAKAYFDKWNDVKATQPPLPFDLQTVVKMQ